MDMVDIVEESAMREVTAEDQEFLSHMTHKNETFPESFWQTPPAGVLQLRLRYFVACLS